MTPNSVSTAVAFALLIVPGFMALSGFSISRARSSPERDLYALAQAVVVSLGWLLIVYLVQTRVGHPARSWGVVPFNDAKVASNREHLAVTAIGLVMVVPFALGALFGGVLNRLRDSVGDRIDVPEAWEAGWARARDFHGSPKLFHTHPVRAQVVLKDGNVMEGVSQRESDVDYAPSSSRDIFLGGALAYTAEGKLLRQSEVGAFIAGSEIVALFFEPDGGSGRRPSPFIRRLRHVRGAVTAVLLVGFAFCFTRRRKDHGSV
jgi:Family of unknown function (DUF6338)